jgi:hypothetical protein
MNYTTQQLTVRLPIGTKCPGGTENSRIFSSFAMTSGFGNCVVFSPAAEAGDLDQSHLESVQINHVRCRGKRAHKRQSAEGYLKTRVEGEPEWKCRLLESEREVKTQDKLSFMNNEERKAKRKPAMDSREVMIPITVRLE